LIFVPPLKYKREAPEKSRAVHIEKTTAYEKKILRGIRFKVFGSDYHIKKRQNSPEKRGCLVNGDFYRMDSLNEGMN
jgi:hypothetical protein